MAPRVRRIAGFKWKATAGDPVIDGAGNRFDAYMLLKAAPNNQAYLVIEKTTRAGVLSQVAEITPALGKGDTCGIAQSGADLHYIITAHDGDNAAIVIQDALQGVCVPYAGNQPQLAQEGAYVPAGEPVSGITLDDLRRELAAQRDGLIAELEQMFGGNIRQGIEDKCRDAIRELNMHSASMQERGVDQWARDRVFEVLRDNGLLGRARAAVGRAVGALRGGLR